MSAIEMVRDLSGMIGLAAFVIGPIVLLCGRAVGGAIMAAGAFMWLAAVGS